ncbi:MAG: amino acid adenylation domain-containing protein [Taibaiella sp.]|nr:amino acid adenylation domain-containing protein [Taibaiella sp.]
MSQENNYNLNEIEFDPFAGPEVSKFIPATEPQLEIWMSCHIGADDANRCYNESVSLELKGVLNKEALSKALQEIVNRHEALRCVFSTDGKQICVYKEMHLPLAYEDLTNRDFAVRQQYIQEILHKNALTSFDLLNGPLIRVSLFRLSDTEHYLLLTAHHIICDGWSLGLILEELSKLYNAYSYGQEPDLPIPGSFSRFATDELSFSHTEEYKKVEDYWINKYSDTVPELNIPTDFPHPAKRTYKSHRDDYSLEPLLVDSIKKLGATSGTGFVTTILAAFEVYFQQLSGQSDIIIGLPSAGQSAANNYSLVGHCVHLLPIRSHNEEDVTFKEYLEIRRPLILDDYEHQNITMGALLKKISIARDPSRVPMVPVVLNIYSGIEEGVHFTDLEHKLHYNPREYETFELFLNIVSEKGGVTIEWSYNTQLFQATTIRQMMADFELLLKIITTEPDRKIKDISLGHRETLSAPIERNNISIDFPRDTPLHHLTRDVARRYPNKVAVRSGSVTLTYKDLNKKANQLAAYLIKKGIKAGDIVGVALDRTPELLITLVGILKAGAAYLPIDPEYPKARIDFMLSDSAAKLVITSLKYTGNYSNDIEELCIDEIQHELSRFSKDNVRTPMDGSSLAYILYTSGSTGMPKGVLIEHHSLVNFLLSMQKKPGITDKDKLLAITTISFDIAGLELFLPLISGAEIVLADTETAKDGRLLLEVLKKEKITILQATPSTWQMILNSKWSGKLPVKALCGGEALTRALADKLIARSSSLWNMYGPTETTIWSCIKEIKAKDGVITIGHPIDNTQVYILDDNKKELRPGITGNIYIGGDGVARGYHNRPELMEDRFIPDTFGADPSKHLYCTGDMGRVLQNGEIQFAGRKDHQVKLRGYRIELGEIENTLERITVIKQAVAVVHDERIIAYIITDTKSSRTPSNDNEITESSPEHIHEWRAQLKQHLPAYMLPNTFIDMQAFPLTPNGKIDRAALPKPSAGTRQKRTEYSPPRNTMEKLLVDIWQDVLDIDKIGIHDDFFELGGHSQIGMLAMAKLEQETGKRLPLVSLFEATTIEKLAQLANTDESTIRWNSLVPIKATGNKLPIYIVHGYGMNVLSFRLIARNMDEEQPVYALQAQGLNGRDEPPDNMEDIAALYVAEILMKNPADEFALSGYSYGGTIAFEMAKQLQAMGKKVKMLAMFDAYADNSMYTDKGWVRLSKKIKRQVPKLLFILKSLATYPKDTLKYQLSFLKKVSDRISPAEVTSIEDTLHDAKLTEIYERAYVNYKLTPYDGVIDLFKVKKRIYYIDNPKYMGWKHYAKQIVIHKVSGDHKTFYRPPFDKAFARKLQATLDERVKQ